MKNKITDLNNHLFAQLERLQDESLSGDEIQKEVHRAKATADVARQVVDAGRLTLEAQKLAIAYKDETGEVLALPELIGATIDG